MTALRDEFDVVHRREGKFDYVTWSQVADRLDESGEEWSFAIIGIGEDWVHGRLRIGERHFENIGYAENASADWKKEALKDASSDAFKRCAALAGVARYLYDKDDSGAASRGPSQPVQNAPQRPAHDPSGQRHDGRASTPPRPHVVDTDLLEDDEANPFDDPAPPRPADDRCPWHPNREPKQGKYGLYCSGQGGSGPLNAKGYCEWKGAA